MMNSIKRLQRANPQQNPVRGFTLLIAVVLTSVLLAIGLALLDIAYKQIVLSSTAKQSQYAFYAADSALECALYADQKLNAFYYNESADVDIECKGVDVVNYSESQSGGIRTTKFSIPCAGGGVSADVTVEKTDGSVACSGASKNCLYATGFNSCNASDARRLERGLKVVY